MTMSKLSGSTTVGKDINGDGIPDIPLRYEFANSKSVVQFPLGFCPNTTLAPGFVQNKSVATMSSCVGQWGIVVKEWETMTATYPTTGKYIIQGVQQWSTEAGKIPKYRTE